VNRHQKNLHHLYGFCYVCRYSKEEEAKMNNTFTTQGSCAKFIDFEIEDGLVTAVKFVGGCNGNLQAVSRLVTGRSSSEVIDLLRGIQCRNGTSCPDQLAQALSQHGQLAEAG
jgi:uncharacterized protein (TIGR03905 family)